MTAKMLGCTSEAAEIRNRFTQVMDDRPKWLQEHTARVIDAAVDLAERHGLDPDVCAAAAAGHDVFRHLAPEDLLARSRAAEIEVTAVEAQAPITLHGPLAARWAAAELNVAHPEILHAIRFHTSCSASLTPEALAVFVADKIEPAKIERNPKLAAVADASRRSLREAAALFLEQRLRRQLKRGELVHPLSVEARNRFRSCADG